MKKLLLLLFPVCGAVTAIAQPTLTSANFCPVIGEIYTNRTCAYSAPGPGGASQTWNFGAVTPTAIGSTTMVAPSSISGSSVFVGATLASNDGGGIGFTAVNSNTFQLVGVRPTPTLNIIYSNREDLMRFPFTMSNTYSDNFAATFTTSGAFYRTGASTVTADGYGTLTTPAGTYTNVLRVRLQQVYKDSTWVGFPYEIYYNNDQYLWFTPGTHNALLTVSTLSTSVGPPSQFLIYLQSISTGVSETAPLAHAFSLYPNPTADRVNFKLHNTNGAEAKAIIYNSAGIEAKQIVLSDNINGLSLDVSDLPDGIYFVRLNVDGILSESKRFVVSK
jgi:hypothetical protein